MGYTVIVDNRMVASCLANPGVTGFDRVCLRW